ncbi:unnamed protein product [Acanthosepion pharaonis]|uniref:EH domain-containing protein n=1 Tax=Acanthosepion pharaonis TaxID=158019 RepID=A0A812D1F9_ACAPH|nr:unnamed protein product [Sepia pharaonis]
MAPAPMMAQGIYPVQGAYIATPMAMIAPGNMPPPPPYTPQMAQSPHAPKGGFPMGISQGVISGMVPGQMIGGMQPNARPPDDQKKGRHFHEQQMKLKLLGTMGMTSTDPDRMIESMFGKMSKSKPKPAVTNTTAIDSDPDSFGDFMQGPSSTSDSTSSDKHGSADSKLGVEKKKKSKTTIRTASNTSSSTSSSTSSNTTTATNPNSEEKKKTDEKKDLMAMMLQYSDLKVSQKPKTFQKKTLRDVNPIPTSTVKTTSYTTSERSRKWEDVDDTLSGLFKTEEQIQLPLQDCMCSHQSQQLATTPDSGNTTPTVSQYPAGPFQTLPAWCYMDDEQLPHVYRQVYEASSANDCILTDRLYPILLLSGLPRQTLREIWEVCNMTTPGQLMKPEMYFMCATNITKPEFETLPELSAEDKYSNVRNFFCSDDSSGTSTNSFDDDYDDFKSADSKPSDDTSHLSFFHTNLSLIFLSLCCSLFFFSTPNPFLTLDPRILTFQTLLCRFNFLFNFLFYFFFLLNFFPPPLYICFSLPSLFFRSILPLSLFRSTSHSLLAFGSTPHSLLAFGSTSHSLLASGSAPLSLSPSLWICSLSLYCLWISLSLSLSTLAFKSISLSQLLFPSLLDFIPASFSLSLSLLFLSRSISASLLASLSLLTFSPLFVSLSPNLQLRFCFSLSEFLSLSDFSLAYLSPSLFLPLCFSLSHLKFLSLFFSLYNHLSFHHPFLTLTFSLPCLLSISPSCLFVYFSLPLSHFVYLIPFLFCSTLFPVSLSSSSFIHFH